MATLELSFDCGDESFSVRRFAVKEAVSTPFTVSVWARTRSQDVDLEAIVGKPASLRIASDLAFGALGGGRTWAGVCSSIEQVKAEPTGLSTYAVRIVPVLWLLTQRRNHRVFQHLSIPDIADELLREWTIEPVWTVDRGAYPKLDYKVQYGESDYSFLCRLLEEAGISYTFQGGGEEALKLALGDQLHLGEPRKGPPLPYVDNPNEAAEKEYLTRVRLAREVRPGAYAIRDHDFRSPGFALFGEAAKASGEERLEQYHYTPGGFLIETGKPGDTPVADGSGAPRHDQRFGAERAERALLGERLGRELVSFETNAIDLSPGVVFSIDRHPHADLDPGKKLLVTELSIEGSPDGEWSTSGQAVFADRPHRPAIRTPKPKAQGVQTATVVGPKGQEIHTDEFGRVRIQFPWDRKGKNDEQSSCWVRVSQGWAGTGFGMMTIPRIGHEVLVGFLEGDPERPVVVGRVFNAVQQVPYKLPQHKTRSTWKSQSSPGAEGFNEIMFEDLAGKELVYLQAEKNLRKLVKNDETITVGNSLHKYVAVSEFETTGLNRTEVTGGNRTEITGANRTTIIGGNRAQLVKADEVVRTDGSLTLYVGRDQDIVVKGLQRERVDKDSHLRVKGKRSQKIDRSSSLTVGKDRHEKVGNNHALDVGKEIHLKAGSTLVIEAAMDLTIKGPGGFLRIDASGVTIEGKLVKINSGGSPGSGSGANPELPEEPIEATVGEPDRPQLDDVAKTGLRQ